MRARRGVGWSVHAAAEVLMAIYACLILRPTLAAWVTDNLLRCSRKEHPHEGWRWRP